MFSSGSNWKDQFRSGGCRRVLVINDGKRQRTQFACRLCRGNEIETASGLRYYDEQYIAQVRRPFVGGHNGRCRGRRQQTQVPFEEIAQINAHMTRATTPAENDDLRAAPFYSLSN